MLITSERSSGRSRRRGCYKCNIFFFSVKADGNGRLSDDVMCFGPAFRPAVTVENQGRQLHQAKLRLGRTGRPPIYFPMGQNQVEANGIQNSHSPVQPTSLWIEHWSSLTHLWISDSGRLWTCALTVVRQELGRGNNNKSRPADASYFPLLFLPSPTSFPSRCRWLLLPRYYSTSCFVRFQKEKQKYKRKNWKRKNRLKSDWKDETSGVGRE